MSRTPLGEAVRQEQPQGQGDEPGEGRDDELREEQGAEDRGQALHPAGAEQRAPQLQGQQRARLDDLRVAAVRRGQHPERAQLVGESPYVVRGDVLAVRRTDPLGHLRVGPALLPGGVGDQQQQPGELYDAAGGAPAACLPARVTLWSFPATPPCHNVTLAPPWSSPADPLSRVSARGGEGARCRRSPTR